MFHVKSLIQQLNYDDLVNDGTIQDIIKDDLWTHIQGSDTKYDNKFPYWVLKSKCIMEYGTFMDLLVRKMIHEQFAEYVTMDTFQGYYTHDSWKDCVKYFLDDVFNHSSIPKPELSNVYKNFGTWTNIYKWLKECIPILLTNYIELAPEYNINKITSHPDIIIDDCIIDIKTTTSFAKMEQETILQLLSYYSIQQELGNTHITKVCVMLPMQRKLLIYEPKVFRHRRFLNLLQVQTHTASNPISSLQIRENVNIYNILNKIGTHIHKVKGSIFESILKTYETDKFGQRPCQLFIRPNRNGNIVSFEKDDLKKTRKYVDKHKIQFFTHTPYFINLCNPQTVYSSRDEKNFDKSRYKKYFDEKDAKVSFCLGIVKEDLEITNLCGGKGVVIHLGKAKDIPIQDATDNMYKHIQMILEQATNDCPLLLETSCGQGSELCHKYEDLKEFYLRLTPSEREKCKICIDLCHVFVSGYEPDEFITSWIQDVGANSIGLIHFNNSKNPKSSHTDRHAPIFVGKIDPMRMLMSAYICNQWNIPIIIE